VVVVVVEDDPLAIADHVKSEFEINLSSVVVLIHVIPAKDAAPVGFAVDRTMGVGNITHRPVFKSSAMIPGNASV
jgi:hypothetical protein